MLKSGLHLTKVAVKETLVCKSFAEWIPEWESDIMDSRGTMSLLMDSFNKEMDYKLKGKLCSVIGYGGSKKSLYALNCCLENITKNNTVAIYSTMEMSAKTFNRPGN